MMMDQGEMMRATRHICALIVFLVIGAVTNEFWQGVGCGVVFAVAAPAFEA